MTKYLLGIDGGGSKTDFLLCDLELNEVARRFSSRSNPNDIGIDAVLALLRENITALLDDSGVDKNDVTAAFAGIAGLTSCDYAKRVVDLLKELLPNAKVDALHDGINVLYSAFPEGDGVSIICGTGSSCFVKRQNEIIRIGGYGSFDLLGNGYEIGRRAIAHAVKTIDGRETEGILEELLHEKLGDDFLKALDSLLLMTKDELARFTPLVFEAAEKGDANALQIIRENMEYIAQLINRAGDYFDSTYPVALAGGVLNADLSVTLISSMINPKASLTHNSLAPSFGAAAKAKSLL